MCYHFSTLTYRLEWFNLKYLITNCLNFVFLLLANNTLIETFVCIRVVRSIHILDLTEFEWVKFKYLTLQLYTMRVSLLQSIFRRYHNVLQEETGLYVLKWLTSHFTRWFLIYMLDPYVTFCKVYNGIHRRSYSVHFKPYSSHFSLWVGCFLHRPNNVCVCVRSA